MTTHIFPIYGQGGKVVDSVLSGDGLGHMEKVLDAIPGVVAHGAFNWDAGSDVFRRIRTLPLTDKIVIGPAVSLAGNQAPAIAAALVGFRDVDLIIGIQPSLAGPKNLVPINVKRAVCIYNPIWIITWGLGAYCWQLKPGNTRTHLITVKSYWPHPGDNNSSVRDRVSQEITALAGIK